jgi:hypothetical protein
MDEDASVPKNNSTLYVMAALLTISIVPYTIVAMSTTIDRLVIIAEQAARTKEGGGASAIDDEEVGELLRNWTVHNGIRSLFPFFGAIVGFVAVLA